MSTVADDDAVAVLGAVQGPFGVKGWVRIRSFTDPAENLLDYSPWLLKSTQGWRQVTCLAARAHGQGLVAELEGVADRDAAAGLKGALIGVLAASLPEPAEDEFYWRDLIGLVVLDQAGTVLGTVVEMMATGANDVLVVALADGGGQELIPFDRRYVTAIDVAGGSLVVDWDVGAGR